MKKLIIIIILTLIVGCSVFRPKQTQKPKEQPKREEPTKPLRKQIIKFVVIFIAIDLIFLAILRGN